MPVSGRLLRATCLTAIVTLLGQVLPSPALAQGSDEDDYIALIDAYAQGETRGAAEALSERDDRWVSSVLAATERHARDWTPERTRAAALLHTETVVGGWVLPAHVAIHLGAARRYVDGRRGQPQPPEFLRGWLLAICWHFQSGLEFGALVPWLNELRDRFPDWGETALASGIFYESIGSGDSMPSELSALSRVGVLAGIRHGAPREALEEAAAAFQRAAADPSLAPQASIRRGRVLAELGRGVDARAELSRLVKAAPERRWRYLAALFLASAEARTGDAAAEQAAYEEAARLMPGCQTALVGLAALQRRQGHTSLALDAAEALTLDTRGCDDPWWFYRFGQPPDRLPELLASLRRTVP